MKRSSLAKLLIDVRHNFWLRPLVVLALGISLGIAATEFDHWLIATDRATGFGPGTSPSGARAVLSVAAGALATTLAIALSMMMVTVQLASSQYTPRLLRRFLADRFTQSVLGAFLATIAFAFLVLRAVRSPEEGTMFVPVVSLTTAVVLTLACFALLVVLLHRTMREMQASTIVADVGSRTARMVAALDEASWRPELPALEGPPHEVRAIAPGYVQLVDDRAMSRLLADATVVRCEASPGTFVLPGSLLLSVYGLARPTPELEEALRACFTLGRERTQEHDPGFGVRQLVDMALKALSPGINDVTTAILVVNELGVIARALVDHGPVTPGWRARVDPPHPAYVERALDLDTLLHLAFDEIMIAAATQPRVHVRILELVATLARSSSRCGVDDVLSQLQRSTREALGTGVAIERGVPKAERDRLLANALRHTSSA